jgi:hypothetical protein
MRRVLVGVAIVAAIVIAALILRAQRPARKKAGDNAPIVVHGAPGRIAGAPEPELVADSDPRGTLRLEGQVIDAREAPAAGAVVALGGSPPRMATTDVGGSFHFDGLLARSYVLVAHQGQRSAGPVTVRLTASSEPVTLRLRPAASIEVTVVGAADPRPIEGAQVELRGVEITGATTNKDGRALFDGLAPGNYAVAAWAPGFAHSFVRVRIPGQFVATGLVERPTLRLRAGAPASGRVLDETGAAVAGAQVMWVSLSSASEADARRDAAVTAADGGFRFDALAAGSYRFVGRHDAHGPGSSASVTLDGQSERAGIDIKLEAGASIEGQVVAKAGGAVAGAAVRVATAGGRGAMMAQGFDPVRQTFTDGAGHFRLSGLPRRDVNLVALHESASSDNVTLHLGDTPVQHDVRITLDLEGTIAGVVVDSGGKPVADASVWALTRGGFRLRGPTTDRTDQAGHFELRGLLPETYYLFANRSGDPPFYDFRWQGIGNGTAAEAGDKNVKLVLGANGAVKGRVMLADGHPPPFFTVRVGRTRAMPFTSADGAFLVDEIPIGSADVVVGGAGFEPGQAKATIETGRVADVGTITVKPGRTISGHVLTADRRPAPGATIYGGASLAGDGTQPGSSSVGPGRWGGAANPSPMQATADEQGSYFLSGVGTTDLLLMADHDNLGRSQPVTVPGSTDSQTVDLILAPFCSLDGVVTQDSQPAAGIPITAAPQGTPDVTFSVSTGPDGTFRFDRLAPDNYRVSAIGRGGRGGIGLRTAVVTLAAGQNGHVQLTMDTQGVTLLVTAQGADGSPATAQIAVIQGAVQAVTAKALRLAVSTSSASYTYVGFSGGGRPARAQNLQPGAYTVCAIPLPAGMQGGGAWTYLQQNADKLAAFCLQRTVAADPAEQPVQVPVTVPPEPGH